MPKNKQKKITCMTCKEQYNPQRYGTCPMCMQVGTLAVIGKTPSHNPQAYKKYKEMGLLEKPKRR